MPEDDGEDDRETPMPEDVIKDNDRWTTGDFSIITSNNFRFRVESCHLMSASAVLRGVGALNQDHPNEIHLTDRTFEKDYTVDDFLELIVNCELPDLTWSDKQTVAARVCLLAMFLQKWECDHYVRLLRKLLRCELAENPNLALVVFAVGAVTEEIEDCLLALRKIDYCHWGEARLRPGRWGSVMIDVVPRDYTWSLIYACERPTSETAGAVALTFHKRLEKLKGDRVKERERARQKERRLTKRRRTS